MLGTYTLSPAPGGTTRVEYTFETEPPLLSDRLVEALGGRIWTRRQAARALRPGGRLVVADMMFGRGGSRRDRDILRQKVTALADKGIGGWWRIAKNLTRYGLGVGHEHPAPPEFWQQALRDAGLVKVRFAPVAAEAGIVCGIRPARPPGR